MTSNGKSRTMRTIEAIAYYFGVILGVLLLPLYALWWFVRLPAMALRRLRRFRRQRRLQGEEITDEDDAAIQHLAARFGVEKGELEQWLTEGR